MTLSRTKQLIFLSEKEFPSMALMLLVIVFVTLITIGAKKRFNRRVSV